MTKPRVYNKHHGDAPQDAVYIGRGSPWGNPFVIGRDGPREEVIARFAREVLPKLDLRPLRGKSLVCFCAPKACHGDVLLETARLAASAIAETQTQDAYDNFQVALQEIRGVLK
mgnify:CR=1 FL=1